MCVMNRYCVNQSKIEFYYEHNTGDDALQVRTNAILQDMFPSEQRATSTSIESFCFSVKKIINF